MEEPIFYDGGNHLELTQQEGKDVFVLVPYLRHGLTPQEIDAALYAMINNVLESKNIDCYCAWYYTPMALSFTEKLKPNLVVYDCMDELAAFKFAPPQLLERECQLLKIAGLVFTGGYSIYEAKKNRHTDVYAFPSSIDKEHFAKARLTQDDAFDQQNIPHPRFGFFGVVDERFDIALVEKVALQKPGWHFIIIGPVVKIDVNSLPQLDNIHYLGGKSYQQLPHYLAGWDIAIMPFAMNESTRFISPTKTPEYLAGGKPVISTPVKDVVDQYGVNGLVYIAGDDAAFIKAAEDELQVTDKSTWLAAADDYLKDNSWNNTWNNMVQLMGKKLAHK